MAAQPEIPDEELIQRFFDCENDLIGDFMERYWPQLSAYLRRCGTRHDDIEDAIQDISVQMFMMKKNGERMPAKAFVGAMFNLAKWRQIDRVRREKKLTDISREIARRHQRKQRKEREDSAATKERDRLKRVAKWIAATRKAPDVMIVGLLSKRSPIGVASLAHGDIAVLLNVASPTVTRRWHVAKKLMKKLFPDLDVTL